MISNHLTKVDLFLQMQEEILAKAILSKSDRKLWVPSHTYGQFSIFCTVQLAIKHYYKVLSR